MMLQRAFMSDNTRKVSGVRCCTIPQAGLLLGCGRGHVHMVFNAIVVVVFILPIPQIHL